METYYHPVGGCGLYLHNTPYDPPPPYSDVDPSIRKGSYECRLQLYDGEIAYTDEHVSMLLKGLGEKNLLDNRLIVLTADHGEGPGEHRENTHDCFAYEQNLHVPLIFSMPGKLPQGEIHRGPSGHIVRGQDLNFTL